MKASEMANEELAECIESARLAPAKYVREDELNFHREAIREAAARLRNLGKIGEAVGREATREKSSRVVNAAKMREALGEISREIWESIDPFCNDDCCKPKRELAKIADAAIASPPRNCDVGTVEEQAERFRRFCETHKPDESQFTEEGELLCPSTGCELIACNHGQCALAWSQMPYEEGGAK